MIFRDSDSNHCASFAPKAGRANMSILHQRPVNPGSVQHVAGMKSSDVIIAFNIDPNAAIIANCGYYVVADLFEVLPELGVQLEKLKSQNERSFLRHRQHYPRVVRNSLIPDS